MAADDDGLGIYDDGFLVDEFRIGVEEDRNLVGRQIFIGSEILAAVAAFHDDANFNSPALGLDEGSEETLDRIFFNRSFQLDEVHNYIYGFGGGI